MAYFSPTHIKVGIASEKRHSIRLLEQGARAAIIINRFENAQKARELEARLCDNKGILERLTSDSKLKLLCGIKYDFKTAKDLLIERVKELYNTENEYKVIDLMPYYFYGNNETPHEYYRVENEKENIVSGELMGLIGDAVVLKQPSTQERVIYAMSIKKFISHVVNIYLNRSIATYSLEPRQLTLWG